MSPCLSCALMIWTVQDHKSLKQKIDRKQAELERAEKRLKGIKKVRYVTTFVSRIDACIDAC